MDQREGHMGNAPDLDLEERDLHVGLEPESRLRRAGQVSRLEVVKAELRHQILLHRLRQRMEIALVVVFVCVGSPVETVDLRELRTPRHCWAHCPKVPGHCGGD